MQARKHSVQRIGRQRTRGRGHTTAAGRVRLQDDKKLVDGTGFFNTEALPEGSILIFPVAIKKNDDGLWSMALDTTEWKESNHNNETFWSNELYFGGLESIGFGRCQVTLTGQYFNQEEN